VELSSELLKYDLFSDLSKEQVAKFARCSEIINFKKDDFIFKYHEKADRFYFLISGKVSLNINAKGNESIPIQTINEGQILGLSWLTPPYQWYFDGIAITDVTAICIDSDCARHSMEQDYELGYKLLKRFMALMSGRLQATRLQLLDIYSE